MLGSIKELTGYSVLTIDGSILGLSSFLFDDTTWLIRYLIAEVPMGDNGNTKKALIAPFSFGIPNSEHREFPLTLAVQKIQESPLFNIESPITRKQQLELYKYYELPPYDKNTMDSKQPPIFINDSETERIKGISLLHTERTIGYRIEADNGEIGVVHDFIVDEEHWIIRYLVGVLRERKSGKKFLIFPKVIREINKDEGRLFISLSKDVIMSSPEYNPSFPIEREDEIRLHQYYGFVRYWD